MCQWQSTAAEEGASRGDEEGRSSQIVSIVDGTTTSYQMSLQQSGSYEFSVASYIRDGYNDSNVTGMQVRTTFYPTTNKERK